MKISKWLIALKIIYLKTKAGKQLTNDELAHRMGGGYAERNSLAESGKIEQQGIKVGRRWADDGRYKLYWVEPESMVLAETILRQHELI